MGGGDFLFKEKKFDGFHNAEASGGFENYIKGIRRSYNVFVLFFFKK